MLRTKMCCERKRTAHFITRENNTKNSGAPRKRTRKLRLAQNPMLIHINFCCERKRTAKIYWGSAKKDQMVKNARIPELACMINTTAHSFGRMCTKRRRDMTTCGSEYHFLYL